MAPNVSIQNTWACLVTFLQMFRARSRAEKRKESGRMEKEGEEKEMRRQEGEKESSKLVDGEILKCGHNFP